MISWRIKAVSWFFKILGLVIATIIFAGCIRLLFCGKFQLFAIIGCVGVIAGIFTYLEEDKEYRSYKDFLFGLLSGFLLPAFIFYSVSQEIEDRFSTTDAEEDVN